MASQRLRIVVLGYIVRGPIGGMAWHHLQYVMGLRDLGHDVIFLEDSDDYPSCYDPEKHVTGTDPSYGLGFAARVFDKVALGDHWGYYDAHTSTWHGPLAREALAFCKSADLVLNISGVNPLREWIISIPSRVIIDTDPVFTQVGHLTEPSRRTDASQHTSFFTFGENIARGSALVPDDGFPWQATRQPIVLNAWPVIDPPRNGKFTTVMQWDSYPAREYEGVRYGVKSDSFGPYINLPRMSGGGFELAIGSASAPRDMLESHGWELANPLAVAGDPWEYQKYIRNSRGEFGIAKQGYVGGRSGWFSERSAAYLASGRPVLAQETGFSDWLPSGQGILSFSSAREVLEGMGEVNSRYEYHCRKAREIAEEYFSADRVLTDLIEKCMHLGTA